MWRRLILVSLVGLLVSSLTLPIDTASAENAAPDRRAPRPAATEPAAPPPTTSAAAAGSIVVQPNEGVSIDKINAAHGTATLFQFTDSSSALVSTPDLSRTLAAMAKNWSIRWFEANNAARQPAAKDDSGADPYCPTTSTTVAGALAQDDSGADPYCTQVVTNGARAYARQWLDVKINLRWAHKRTTGQGVTIAVLDTQVEESHPALAGKLLPSVDLVPLDPSTNVPTTGVKRGHGTFVAGMALHVAPAAKVLPVRVLNEDGRGSTSLVAEGIRRAAKAGAKVINLSLSTPTPARAMQEAVAYAQARGAIIVAAYGNEGQQDPAVYPADFPSVISVVATDEDDVRASFTNYGRKADVAAPGVGIVAPWRDGQYGIGNGTSYAAPVVAGQAALLVSAGLVRNQTEAHARISTAVDNIDGMNAMRLGYGRIDLPASMAR